MTEREYTPTTEQIFSWLCEITTENDVRGIRRWLAERDRQVAERAWDEGYDSGFDRGVWGDQPRANPYREQASND